MRFTRVNEGANREAAERAETAGESLAHASGPTVDRESFHDRTLSSRRRRSSTMRYAPTPMISTTPTIDAARLSSM